MNENGSNFKSIDTVDTQRKGDVVWWFPMWVVTRTQCQSIAAVKAKEMDGCVLAGLFFFLPSMSLSYSNFYHHQDHEMQLLSMEGWAYPSRINSIKFHLGFKGLLKRCKKEEALFKYELSWLRHFNFLSSLCSAEMTNTILLSQKFQPSKISWSLIALSYFK